MESKPNESLTIVMAAYNEEDSLPYGVQRALEFLETHVKDGELILVNDGSTDGTGAAIATMAAMESHVRAFHLSSNQGMGAALLLGFSEALKDWVTILPADCQLDPFELLDFFDVSDHAD